MVATLSGGAACDLVHPWQSVITPWPLSGYIGLKARGADISCEGPSDDPCDDDGDGDDDFPDDDDADGDDFDDDDEPGDDDDDDDDLVGGARVLFWRR